MMHRNNAYRVHMWYIARFIPKNLIKIVYSHKLEKLLF